MKGVYSLTFLFGRICMCILFLWAGINKFLDYDNTAKYMQSYGMTMIPLFLYGAAAVEILGGLSLLLGYYTRAGASILLLFLIPTTLIFHSFWLLEGNERSMEMTHFLNNLAIFGGLLYVLSAGAGRFSVDAAKEPTKSI